MNLKQRERHVMDLSGSGYGPMADCFKSDKSFLVARSKVFTAIELNYFVFWVIKPC